MAWTTEITLKNNLNRSYKCKIPKGQVFENKKVGTGIQNVAAAKEYIFDLPPNSTGVFTIEVLCINEHLGSPKGNYNATFFKVNRNFNDQNELWSIMKP